MPTMTPRMRRLGRVIAMQALYEIDAVGNGSTTTVETTIETLAAEHDAPENACAFAAALVQGVLEHLAAIDATLTEAAPQFPLAQVAGVDKAVLRLAVYELRYGANTPVKVVINEAIEIAKEYGGEHSGRFVNGVLGYVASSQ